MSVTLKTYSALSTSEQDVYEAVSVTGSFSDRPTGVTVLSPTPGLSDFEAGGLDYTVSAEGPTDIIDAME